jgi:hypothetical protein
MRRRWPARPALPGLAAPLFLLTLAAATAAQADGKFFWREQVPLGVPYQRALVLFDRGRETLLVQSRYAASGPAAPAAEETAGWVVPVPAVPEIASLPAADAGILFHVLGSWSAPDATLVRLIVGNVLFVLTLVLLAAAILGAVLGALLRLSRAVAPRIRPVVWKVSAVAGIGFVVGVIVLLVLSGGFVKSASSGVEIIDARRVGIYDVKVIRAGDGGPTGAEGLVGWLNEHGFRFGAADSAVLADYAKRRWCFVVARIDPRAERKAAGATADRLAAPLILRFPVASPVYPLALTATARTPTRIVLYVAAHSKADVGGALRLKFAGRGSDLRLYLEHVEPAGFFPATEVLPPFLTKFDGTLSPEQMAADLAIALTGDSTPYREDLVIW